MEKYYISRSWNLGSYLELKREILDAFLLSHEYFAWSAKITSCGASLVCSSVAFLITYLANHKLVDDISDVNEKYAWLVEIIDILSHFQHHISHATLASHCRYVGWVYNLNYLNTDFSKLISTAVLNISVREASIFNFSMFIVLYPRRSSRAEVIDQFKIYFICSEPPIFGILEMNHLTWQNSISKVDILKRKKILYQPAPLPREQPWIFFDSFD